MGIVDRVRMLCEERGISINKLEMETGIGRGNVARWDAHTPGSERVQKVADYFNVTAEYILNGTNKKRPAIDMTSLSDAQKELIDLVPTMSESNIKALLSHAQGLIMLQQSQDGQQ